MLLKILKRLIKILDSYFFTQKIRNINKTISEISSKPQSHIQALSADKFMELQAKYKPRDQYKYDSYSNWERGVNRAKQLINIDESFKNSQLDILELCCGDGMTGKILLDYGHNVKQHDIYDWRDSRSKSIRFIEHDLSAPLLIKDQKFDLIFSFNSFEHIPDPELTLSNIKDHLKNGGYIFLEFGPLYNSPWGLHAYRTIYFPYPQFLFSEEFINEKLHELGVNDLGKDSDELQPLNKWSYEQFDKLWDNSGFQIIKKETGRDFTHLNIIKEFSGAFSNKDLDIIELTTQWIRVILKKSRDL